MSSLREILGSFRGGPAGLRRCPNCGSAVVRSRALLDGWILPVKYICKACGYEGFVSLEEEREPEP